MTVRKIAVPGTYSSQGNEVSARRLRAWFSMLPHDAAGSWTPTPRNDSTTSPRM